MRGGDENLLKDAALIGTGAYLAKQNPDTSTLGIIGIAAKYALYVFLGFMAFILILFLFAWVFGKKKENFDVPTEPSEKGDKEASTKAGNTIIY
jgi:uncharacterized membrane protein